MSHLSRAQELNPCHAERRTIVRRDDCSQSKHPYTLMTAREQRSYCVYIMGSLSGTLYIGFTGNLHKRIFEHKFHQKEGFTNRYDVERLLYWASFDDVLHKAIAREKQLKGWSRAKKIVLIELRNPQWLDLAKEWYPRMTGSSTKSSDASTAEARPLDDPPPLSMTDGKSNQ